MRLKEKKKERMAGNGKVLADNRIKDRMEVMEHKWKKRKRERYIYISMDLQSNRRHVFPSEGNILGGNATYWCTMNLLGQIPNKI